jgi:hypothetical protein
MQTLIISTFTTLYPLLPPEMDIIFNFFLTSAPEQGWYSAHLKIKSLRNFGK